MVVGEPGVAPRQQRPAHGSARERAGFRQAGWHRREKVSLLSQQTIWDRSFFCPPHKKGGQHHDHERSVQNLSGRIAAAEAWYNLRADMKTDHRPILNPATLQPVTVDDLSHVFCTKLAEQELNNTDRYIEIPGPVRDFYRMYRPSPPGCAAYFLEQALRYARQDLITNTRAATPAAVTS